MTLIFQNLPAYISTRRGFHGTPKAFYFFSIGDNVRNVKEIVGIDKKNDNGIEYKRGQKQ
jgi:hypothetical protein